jgi:hypothetical protein
VAADISVPVEVPAGPEIRQQVGPVQRLAEQLYGAARALRIRGHHVAASGVEEAAFAATLWSDSPVGTAVAPARTAPLPADLPAVLSSVEDVARVAAAASLGERAGPGEYRIWQSADGAVVLRTRARAPFGVVVYVAGPDGDGYSMSGPRVPLGPVWSAIQAARGGKPRG